jgi:hypothetical protein
VTRPDPNLPLVFELRFLNFATGNPQRDVADLRKTHVDSPDSPASTCLSRTRVAECTGGRLSHVGRGRLSDHYVLDRHRGALLPRGSWMDTNVHIHVERIQETLKAFLTEPRQLAAHEI